MRALFVVTGAVMWALWLGGAVTLLALWGTGKWMQRKARGAENDRPGSAAPVDQHRAVGGMGEPRVTVSPDARGETVAPAPVPFRVTGQPSRARWTMQDVLGEVRK